MTDEAQSCCGHRCSSPYVSSVSYSYTVIKTKVSFSTIHNEMMAASPAKGQERENRIREEKVKHQIMASLPDIRDLLKPWYFQGAQKHNLNAVKQAALDHVNNTNVKMEHELVFRQMKYINGIYDGLQAQHGCHLDHGRDAGENNAVDSDMKTPLAELLCDDDKSALEQMHARAVACKGDTKIVDAVATQVASERVFSRDEHGSVLNRDYFDRVISGMNVWKSHLHDHSMMARMRGVLS